MSQPISHRSLSRIYARRAVAGVLHPDRAEPVESFCGAQAHAPAVPYGLEPYPLTDAEIAAHAPTAWIAEGMIFAAHHDLDRPMSARRLIVSGYADGSGRLCFTGSGPVGDLEATQLWPERPHVAVRLDPVTFGALWMGFFATTPEEPMPTEPAWWSRS